jgi:hypothetical protein
MYHNKLDRSSLKYDLLLFFLFLCVVLLCDFMFLVPWCDVRYDFRIKTMFGSCLTPVVHRMAYVFFTLFVFVCVYSGIQHILCSVFCLLCLSSSFVLCIQCCQCLLISHS